MDLSIVIPVYNEEKKIRADIIAASSFLSGEGKTGEIIVVDDGSTDGTSDVAEGTPVDEGVKIRVVRYNEHSGKGRAVRTGILEAASGLVLFIDSGNCVPFDNLNRGISMIMSQECEIAHGSRFLAESLITQPRKPLRRMVSLLFRKYIRLLCRLPAHLTDTQCGLKIYRGDIARELFDACETDGFLFDIEIILRAKKKGHRILEFPIEWTTDRDSRLSVSKTFFRIYPELRAIRKSLRNADQNN